MCEQVLAALSLVTYSHFAAAAAGKRYKIVVVAVL